MLTKKVQSMANTNRHRLRVVPRRTNPRPRSLHRRSPKVPSPPRRTHCTTCYPAFEKDRHMTAGREYLDFFGGPATISLGHCHPVLVKALTEQAHELIHVSNQFYSIPQLQLAELLIEHSVFDRVYFMNSGAEANEGALKLARKWGKEKRNGAYEFISAIDAFHGRTLQAVTAGGTDRYKAPFGPLPEGFLHVPFNDVDAIKAATSE